MITKNFNTIFPEESYSHDQIEYRTLKLAFFLGASSVVGEIRSTGNNEVFESHPDLSALLVELHEYFTEVKFIQE